MKTLFAILMASSILAAPVMARPIATHTGKKVVHTNKKAPTHRRHHRAHKKAKPANVNPAPSKRA